MLRARLRPERPVEPPIERVGEICGVARASPPFLSGVHQTHSVSWRVCLRRVHHTPMPKAMTATITPMVARGPDPCPGSGGMAGGLRATETCRGGKPFPVPHRHPSTEPAAGGYCAAPFEENVHLSEGEVACQYDQNWRVDLS